MPIFTFIQNKYDFDLVHKTGVKNPQIWTPKREMIFDKSGLIKYYFIVSLPLLQKYPSLPTKIKTITTSTTTTTTTTTTTKITTTNNSKNKNEKISPIEGI